MSLSHLTPGARADLEKRFWSHTLPEPNSGCWLWEGSLSRYGYGRMHNLRDRKSGPKIWQAHRLAYELYVGPIPNGLQLDHKCRLRACVNPNHLEPVTLAENIRRGETGISERRKTHCPKGHPYSGDNLFVRNGDRFCRACSRQWARAYHARKRSK